MRPGDDILKIYRLTFEADAILGHLLTLLPEYDKHIVEKARSSLQSLMDEYYDQYVNFYEDLMDPRKAEK